VLPEADGTGSRSGSAGRDGPGTDGRGVVGVVGGTGAGRVGLGAVSCTEAAGAVWCGWLVARGEPVDWAGAAVPPAGACGVAVGWTLAVAPGEVPAGAVAADWAGRTAGVPGRIGCGAGVVGFAVAAGACGRVADVGFAGAGSGWGDFAV
jgi:hypothetical protein